MYGINNVHSYCDTGMSAGYHSMAVFRLLVIFLTILKIHT